MQKWRAELPAPPPVMEWEGHTADMVQSALQKMQESSAGVDGWSGAEVQDLCQSRDCGCDV